MEEYLLANNILNSLFTWNLRSKSSSKDKEWFIETGKVDIKVVEKTLASSILESTKNIAYTQSDYTYRIKDIFFKEPITGPFDIYPVYAKVYKNHDQAPTDVFEVIEIKLRHLIHFHKESDDNEYLKQLVNCCYRFINSEANKPDNEKKDKTRFIKDILRETDYNSDLDLWLKVANLFKDNSEIFIKILRDKDIAIDDIVEITNKLEFGARETHSKTKPILDIVSKHSFTKDNLKNDFISLFNDLASYKNTSDFKEYVSYIHLSVSTGEETNTLHIHDRDGVYPYIGGVVLNIDKSLINVDKIKVFSVIVRLIDWLFQNEEILDIEDYLYCRYGIE